MDDLFHERVIGSVGGVGGSLFRCWSIKKVTLDPHRPPPATWFHDIHWLDRWFLLTISWALLFINVYFDAFPFLIELLQPFDVFNAAEIPQDPTETFNDPLCFVGSFFGILFGAIASSFQVLYRSQAN